MTDAAQTVIALDAQRMVATGAGDAATLDKLIADDLIYVHSSARMDTKASLIGNMKNGSTVYQSVVPSDVKAREVGGAVMVTGLADIKVTVNGNPLAFQVRFAEVWENRAGQWQMVLWQSTKTA